MKGKLVSLKFELVTREIERMLNSGLNSGSAMKPSDSKMLKELLKMQTHLDQADKSLKLQKSLGYDSSTDHPRNRLYRA